jgi:hypothetical protein
LRYAGQNSIVVYLAFFLPMATTRALLLKFAPGLDLGLVALTVTTVAAITPLLFYAVVEDSGASCSSDQPGHGSCLCLASHRRRKSRLSPLRVTRAGP